MGKVNANPKVKNVGTKQSFSKQSTLSELKNIKIETFFEEVKEYSKLAAIDNNNEEEEAIYYYSFPREGGHEPQRVDERREAFDVEEVFNLIRTIRDPEHPLSLEELNVVQEKGISIDNEEGNIVIVFTPTVPHCSMSTLIGLCLRVKLLRSLPPRFKIDIYVEPGSHVSELQVNKQLNDKERVAAALENSSLLSVVNKCLM